MTLFSKSTRLLVCAAHPDDEVLGAGGVISLARKSGAEVRIVFFGEGVSARYEENELGSDAIATEIEERNANALTAANELGVDQQNVFFGNLSCCRFDQVPHISLVKLVEKQLDTFRPTVVLTHAASDTNIDHRLLHVAVLTAARPVRYSDIGWLAAFEVLSSTETNPEAPFAPDTFVDISSVIDDKIAAMAAYGGESPPPPHPRSTETIRSHAVYRGAQGGFVHGEAFKTMRRIVR